MKSKIKSSKYTYDFNGVVLPVKKLKSAKMPPAVYPLE